MLDAYTDRQPDWEVTVLETVSNGLGIKCPHCKQKAVVARTTWVYADRLQQTMGIYMQDTVQRRCCTYCFRWSKVPKKYRR